MADRPTAPGDGGPLAGTPPGPPKPEEVRRAGPLLVLGFLALLGCASLLAVLAVAVRRAETNALDSVGNTVLHGVASPGMDLAMNAATTVGYNPGLLVVAGVATIVLVRARRQREAVFIWVVLGGSILLNSVMKLFFHRVRPVVPWAVAPPDYSFPSGHAMNSMALGLAIALVVWRLAGPRWGALAVIVAVAAAGLIGISRIYLGVHYPTDVLAGWATATLWVAMVAGVFRYASRRRFPWTARRRTS